MKFATKPCEITHLTLGMLLHYLKKSKIQIFCRYLAIIPDTVYSECIVCFYQNLVLVAEYHVNLLTNTAVTSAVMNFHCHKLIATVIK